MSNPPFTDSKRFEKRKGIGSGIVFERKGERNGGEFLPLDARGCQTREDDE